MDIENHSYWVTFDRPGLGKHAIPDTEIKVRLRVTSHSRIKLVYKISRLIGMLERWVLHSNPSPTHRVPNRLR